MGVAVGHWWRERNGVRGAVWMEQKLEDADRTSGCTSDTDNKNRRSQTFTNLRERREENTLHWMGNTIRKKKRAERLKQNKTKSRPLLPTKCTSLGSEISLQKDKVNIAVL